MRFGVAPGIERVLTVGARLRRCLYDQGWLLRATIDAPVISVGALSMGGSGKTPITRWLARHLHSHYGAAVGIVTRGYRGWAGRRVMQVGAQSSGLEVGDEAAMHARSPWVEVVVRGADKARAAHLALARGAEVIVLDDGFQHLALARDLDIVLLDADGGVGAGFAREGAAALESAQLLWIHGRDGVPPRPPKLARGRKIVRSRYLPRRLRSADGRRIASLDEVRGREVFVVAAIARPEGLLRLLKGIGARVVGQELLPDHRPIGSRQLSRCRDRARDALLVCSEKDIFHLDAAPPRDLWALECDVELVEGQQALETALATALGSKTC